MNSQSSSVPPSDLNPLAVGPEILDALGAAAIATGAIKRNGFLPGLSPQEQMRELLASGAEIEFAPEVETWWEWTDGTRDNYANPYRHMLGGFWFLLPLHSAARRFVKPSAPADLHSHTPSQRARALDGSLDGWFPIAAMSRGQLYCECGTGVGPTSRVHLSADTLGIPPHVEPADAPSLGTVVSLWIEAMERAVWSFDASAEKWIVREVWPELPDEYHRFVFDQ